MQEIIHCGIYNSLRFVGSFAVNFIFSFCFLLICKAALRQDTAKCNSLNLRDKLLCHLLITVKILKVNAYRTKQTFWLDLSAVARPIEVEGHNHKEREAKISKFIAFQNYILWLPKLCKFRKLLNSQR